MHFEAHQAVGNIVRNLQLHDKELEGLDLAGRMVNGSTHEHFMKTQWTILDIVKHESVDIVADATTWKPDRLFDVVQSTEGLEHIENWRGLVSVAHAALRGDGWFIMTCGSTGRRPHGWNGEWDPPPGQHYGNVSESEFRSHAETLFSTVNTWYDGVHFDLYAWCQK